MTDHPLASPGGAPAPRRAAARTTDHPLASPGGAPAPRRAAARTTARVDPITLEIVRGSLASTIREMELLMERCAMSPFIKEKKDYFVGVFDVTGRIVACHISEIGRAHV